MQTLPWKNTKAYKPGTQTAPGKPIILINRNNNRSKLFNHSPVDLLSIDLDRFMETFIYQLERRKSL